MVLGFYPTYGNISSVDTNSVYARALTVAGVGTPIPAGATAVVGNLTVLPSTASGGYASVWPYGQSSAPSVSNINWSGQTVVATSFVCGLGSSKLYFAASSTTHVIIDISGYYI